MSAQWNHDGSIFVVAGLMVGAADSKTNLVQFYNTFGEVCFVLSLRIVSYVMWYCMKSKIRLSFSSLLDLINLNNKMIITFLF